MTAIGRRVIDSMFSVLLFENTRESLVAGMGEAIWGLNNSDGSTIIFGPANCGKTQLVSLVKEFIGPKSLYFTHADINSYEEGNGHALDRLEEDPFPVNY